MDQLMGFWHNFETVAAYVRVTMRASSTQFRLRLSPEVAASRHFPLQYIFFSVYTFFNAVTSPTRTPSMQGQKAERWQILCQQVITEQDPDKLIELAQEIIRLLDEKEERLNASRQGVPAPDSRVRTTL